MSNILVHIEPRQRLFGWEDNKLKVDYFPIDLTWDDNDNDWSYDPQTREITAEPGDVDLNSVFTIVTYRLFFSSEPVALPHNLTSGTVVPYLGRLRPNSTFKAAIDPSDFTGVSITGTGTLKLLNVDGHFVKLFDSLFWEKASVSIYNSDFKTIYKGNVINRRYDRREVTFQLRDPFDALRGPIKSSVFTDSGSVRPTLVGKARRQLYGRVKGVACESIDLTFGGGIDLSGTVDYTFDFVGGGENIQLEGTGTNFFRELIVGDSLFYRTDDGEKVSFKVTSITSETFLETDLPVEGNPLLTGLSLKIDPAGGSNLNNRFLNIAGHRITAPSATVTTVPNADPGRIFYVDDASSFEEGERILVGTHEGAIFRVSKNLITLESSLGRNLIPGDVVQVNPIQKVTIRGEPLSSDQYSLLNLAFAELLLTSDAEFSLAPTAFLKRGTMNFNGHVVTGDSTKFQEELAPGDFILPRGEDTWRKVIQVDSDTSLKISTSLTLPSISSVRIKRPKYIENGSDVLVDCYGRGSTDGRPLLTAPDIIRFLLEDAGLGDLVDPESFNEAAKRVPYTCSLKVPKEPATIAPPLRPIINDLNKSVLGSLNFNSEYKISYLALTPDKTDVKEKVITDQNILSWKSSSVGKNLILKRISEYRHSDKEEPLTVERTNTYLENISDIITEEREDLYLFKTSAARTMTERISLLKESPNTLMAIRASLEEFPNILIGDKFIVKLNGLSYLPGRNDSNRIGIVTEVKYSRNIVEFQISDVSGFFYKIANITGSDAPPFAEATSDVIIDGYITDEHGIIDNDRATYRTNLLG